MYEIWNAEKDTYTCKDVRHGLINTWREIWETAHRKCVKG